MFTCFLFFQDDPVCIAANNDGKVLVTELWIEDSVDFSELANADRVSRTASHAAQSWKIMSCLVHMIENSVNDISSYCHLKCSGYSNQGNRFYNVLYANHAAKQVPEY